MIEFIAQLWLISAIGILLLLATAKEDEDHL